MASRPRVRRMISPSKPARNTVLPPPPDEIWICENPDCKIEYTPGSWVQKYCAGCKKYRNRLHAKRACAKRIGRICRVCKRTDHQVGFSTKKECRTCYSRRRTNGSCGRCRQPLIKIGGILRCRRCDPRLDPTKVYQVKLTCQGFRRIVLKSRSGSIIWDGKKVNLSRIAKYHGEISLLVNPNDFRLGHAKRPLAIEGMTKGIWPVSLGWLRDSVIYDLYDLAHFIRIGEACPIRYGWWKKKFREEHSKSTRERAWERLKRMFEQLGAPVKTRIELGGFSSLSADPREFIDGVMSEVRRREPRWISKIS